MVVLTTWTDISRLAELEGSRVIMLQYAALQYMKMLPHRIPNYFEAEID